MSRAQSLSPSPPQIKANPPCRRARRSPQHAKATTSPRAQRRCPYTLELFDPKRCPYTLNMFCS